MDKSEQPPVRDIAAEPYKGPGPVVTAAGEGAIAHYGIALLGLIGGAAATFVFHEKAGQIVGNIRQWAGRQSAVAEGGTLNVVKRKFGEATSVVFGHGKTEALAEARKAIGALPEKEKLFLNDHLATHEQGFGNWFLMHTIGIIPPVKRWLRTLDDRQTMAFTVGGIAGFAGFLLSPIYYGFTGVRHASDGKRQFQEAQDEIITTRAELGTLREKYVATRMELEDLKTTQAVAKGTLKVSGDDTPRMDSAPATAQLAATQADSPVSVSEPKIDAPKVEGPKIETNLPQPPAMPWGEKIATQQAAAELASHEPARA